MQRPRTVRLVEISSFTANPTDKRSKIAKVTPDGVAFLGRQMVELSQELGPIIKTLGHMPFAETLPHLERIREVLDAERDAVDAPPTDV